MATSWEDEWARQQQATRDPHLLLLEVDNSASNATSMAEGTETEQRAAAVFAQVAIARAIAALAGAIMENGRPSTGHPGRSSDPHQGGSAPAQS